MTPIITQLTAEPNPDFAIPQALIDGHYESTLGPQASDAEKQKLKEVVLDAMAKSYTGNAGRLRLHQAAITAVTRDSLLLRLPDVKSPVLWIAASNDPAVSEKAAREDSSLFKSEVRLEIIEGAYHWPTWSHAEQVNKLVSDFIRKHSGLKDARALREAVGMVDI
jgi:pimeloyl-ACP methyl ester carboxylesterase